MDKCGKFSIFAALDAAKMWDWQISESGATGFLTAIFISRELHGEWIRSSLSKVDPN